MPTEEITITSVSDNMKALPGLVTAISSTGLIPVEEPRLTHWTKPYLSADDDPVLAELWDNDDDAVYDSM